MTARNTEELCKDIHNLQASPHRLWVNYKGKKVSLEGHTSGVDNRTSVTDSDKMTSCNAGKT